MRLRFTVFLLMANLAALAAWIVLERQAGAREAFPSGRLILKSSELQQLVKLEISGASMGEVWSFEKRNSGWELLQPIEWNANRYALEQMLAQFSNLEWEARFSLNEVLASGQSIASYGLDNPRVVLQLGLLPAESSLGEAGHITRRIEIGMPQEDGQRLYVRVDDNWIHAVQRSALSSLSNPLEHFLDSSIIEFGSFEVRGLTVERFFPARPRVLLSRDPNQADWSMEAPVRTAANSKAVQEALDALVTAKAQSFHQGNPSEFGFDSISMIVTVVGNGRRAVLELGNRVTGLKPNDRAESGAPKEGVYLRKEGSETIVLTSFAPFANLVEAETRLRERRILSFDPDQLATIEIAGRDRQTRLQRLEGGAWQMLFRDPSNELRTLPADPEIVEDVIAKLRALEASRFVSDAPSSSALESYGLTEPQRIVRLQQRTGSEVTELRIGDLVPDTNGLYAQNLAVPTVYEISPSILYELPIAPISYRVRVLSSLPASVEVLRVQLFDLEKDEVVFDSAAMAVSETSAARAEALAALIVGMREFRVARYLREGFEDPLMLDAQTPLPWKYRLDAQVGRRGGQDSELQVRSYYFSERLGPATQFGGSREHDVLFSIPPEMINIISALESGRSAQ